MKDVDVYFPNREGKEGSVHFLTKKRQDYFDRLKNS